MHCVDAQKGTNRDISTALSLCEMMEVYLHMSTLAQPFDRKLFCFWHMQRSEEMTLAEMDSANVQLFEAMTLRPDDVLLVYNLRADAGKLVMRCVLVFISTPFAIDAEALLGQMFEAVRGHSELFVFTFHPSDGRYSMQPIQDKLDVERMMATLKRMEQRANTFSFEPIVEIQIKK
jgi:hypothetical protein